MLSVRDLAVDILCKCEKNNSYSNLSLLEVADKRDQALLSSLVYGVLEHKTAIDYNISLYLSSPIKKLHPRVLCILRVGAVQLLFMDKIPARAAVNEAVQSAKKSKLGFAGSLINAVLRKISANGVVYPPCDNSLEYLSVRYSCPIWILKSFIENYGASRTKSILETFEGRRPLYCRINTLAGFDVVDELVSSGVKVTATELENCFTLENTGDISALPAFIKGGFHIQDISSQMCCKVLDAKPGETVIDCCAAPGGKTFTTAQYMNGDGIIWSNDVYEHKAKLISDGAERLGLKCIKVICSDATELNKKINFADRVLCDVPCSGLGVIGRKPEIKYKSVKELEALPQLQYSILESCSKAVKKGGILVYSTCTLLPSENGDVCDRFLNEHPEFVVSDDAYYAELCCGERYKTFLPEKNGGDGFFTAKFKRIR